jgi:hypothetical protein
MPKIWTREFSGFESEMIGEAIENPETFLSALTLRPVEELNKMEQLLCHQLPLFSGCRRLKKGRLSWTSVLTQRTLRHRDCTNLKLRFHLYLYS